MTRKEVVDIPAASVRSGLHDRFISAILRAVAFSAHVHRELAEHHAGAGGVYDTTIGLLQCIYNLFLNIRAFSCIGVIRISCRIACSR